MGYNLAGFEVVGVDIIPQPNYPFKFIQADATKLLWNFSDFDAIHASPPCQRFSTLGSQYDRDKYPDYISLMRGQLENSGKYYIIENVLGAPLRDPIKLCGSTFALGVRRHRLFETNFPVKQLECRHKEYPHPIDVTGTGARRLGPRTDGKGGNSRKPRNLDEAQRVMGISWMKRKELSQAIPPLYTKYIGEKLVEIIGEGR